MEHNTTHSKEDDSAQSAVVVEETVIIAEGGDGESPTPFYKRINRRHRTIIGIIILIILLALLAWRYRSWFVAATVNGDAVSRISVIRELERQGAKETLDFLIDKKLINQEAAKRKITVSQDEINEVIKKYEDAYNVDGNTLDKTLEVQGMTRSDLIDQITLQKQLEKLGADKAKVSDEDVRAFITENQVKLEAGKEESTKNQIKEQLRQQKIAEVSEEMLTELRKNAKINRFVNY